MYYRIHYKNELCHFGIKGQRWGVRRYQNEDGTLTAEGKERYNKEAFRDTYNKRNYRKTGLFKRSTNPMHNIRLRNNEGLKILAKDKRLQEAFANTQPDRHLPKSAKENGKMTADEFDKYSKDMFKAEQDYLKEVMNAAKDFAGEYVGTPYKYVLKNGKVVDGKYENTLGLIINDNVEKEYYNTNFMSNEFNKQRVKYKLGT